MACRPERFARLPIPEAQKQLLIAFSADPANDAMSARLCQASDEELISAVSQMAQEQSLQQPQQRPQVQPSPQQGLGSLPNSSPAQQRPPPPAGPISAGRGIPPGQLSKVTRPMDTPPSQGSGNAGLGGLLKRGY